MSELATSLFPARRALAPAAAPDVEIVVPVYNEAAGLDRSIRRLHRFLTDGFPFTWRIVDRRQRERRRHAGDRRRLADRCRRVSHLRLEQKGRGRALRAAWKASPARVVAYMDVDLSTDLRGLLPLVAPLLSGHSDLAIGSRLATGSRVVRGPKRELISRSYNRILRTVLRAKFSDAQCGFKAVRRDVLDTLMDDVQDDGWFFDTELLVLAQRRGLRIHEVPVDWVDDPDSRVNIVRTAVTDLKGVARLLVAGTVARFMAVGVASTLAYALLYVLLHPLVGRGRRESSAWRSPRWPTPPPTGASRSASTGARSWCAITSAAASCSCSRCAHHRRARRPARAGRHAGPLGRAERCSSPRR